MKKINLKKEDAWPIAGRAFPGYKGRKFMAACQNRVFFYNTNWGGGSRNAYRFVELNDNGKVNKFSDPAPWANPVEGKAVEIPTGWAVVVEHIFCGKNFGIEIIVSPEDWPKLLERETDATREY